MSFFFCFSQSINVCFFANSPAEKELLTLLNQRGVISICESISKEINYAWAVLSGFKTLAKVGHFYFACGGETFGYNPAIDFFNSKGMQLALFALQKYVHNDQVLLQALDCIHIYSKLHGEMRDHMFLLLRLVERTND